MSTYKTLIDGGFSPAQPLQVRKSLSVKELGKTYTLDFVGENPSAEFVIDNYIIRDGVRCDRMVLALLEDGTPEKWAQVFVELKGHDSLHGMEQLIATVRNQLFADASNAIRRARLVATSFPSNKANPKVEKLKREFARLGIDYRTIKPGQRDRL